MASRDEIFPSNDCCEICGIVLGDEVVIQEFADGSLARLCPECAAGADLGGAAEAGHKQAANPESIWPDERGYAVAESIAEPIAELDPLEKTKELLMPVTDLIALQGEMQAALERLAGSLERFSAEMITDSQDKTAVESRLETLERELDKTRTKLSETEFLLSVSTPAGAPAGALAEPKIPLDAPIVAPPTALPEVKPPVVEPAGAEPAVATSEAVTQAPIETEPPFVWPDSPETDPPKIAAATAPVVATAPVAATAPEAVAATEAGEEAPSDHLPTFRIEEVQAAQRHYNDSPFTDRIRDVRRSLGKPKANLTRIAGAEPRAVVTIAWDIVWYQYLVDLRRDLPSTVERVTLHREGMDLDELAFYFKEKNAVINDDGRLDASELEVKLLSDPSALITEMTPEGKQIFDDVTEEVWGQRIAPEFKWDD